MAKSFSVLLAAAEALTKGIDFTGKDLEFIKSSLISSEDFMIKVDKEVLKAFNIKDYEVFERSKELYCAVEKLEENEAVHLELTADTAKEIIKALKENSIESFADVDDLFIYPNLLKDLEEADKYFTYLKAPACPLKKLDRDSTALEFKTLLALCKYNEETNTELLNAYKDDAEFVIDSLSNFEAVNNRIIIPLSAADKYQLKQFMKKNKDCYRSEDVKKIMTMTAMVISKNPLDYFYCSYGNSFQSCFSLNSDHAAWYGFIPFAAAPESFIVYATNGNVEKVSVVTGNKFHCPQMLWRAWGFATKDKKLIVDKKYRTNTNAFNDFIGWCCKFLTEKIDAICPSPFEEHETYKLFSYGQNIKKIMDRNQYKTYLDSLYKERTTLRFIYNEGAHFVYESGRGHFLRSCGNFLRYAQTVKSIAESLDPLKPFKIINGVLMNVKTCPTTSLFIEDTQDHHAYSKYFTSPVNSLLCLTYLDGYLSLDGINKEWDIDTIHFYIKDTELGRSGLSGVCLYLYRTCAAHLENAVNLKTLKDHIKGYIKELPVDAVLLRIIEADKITFQVFKNIKKDQ